MKVIDCLVPAHFQNIPATFIHAFLIGEKEKITGM